VESIRERERELPMAGHQSSILMGVPRTSGPS
jgi:hypothetical protein